jgi:hypothetical protein
MSASHCDVVLYFYDEMDGAERTRAAAHLRECAPCRQRLEDLQAIGQALAGRPRVGAPPAGDWSGFTRRLDAALVSERARGTGEPQPAQRIGAPNPRTGTPMVPLRRAVRHVAAFAAMLALVTLAVLLAARYRASTPVTQTAVNTAPAAAPSQPTAPPAPAQPNQSLRESSVEHLERSKLVVLGLTARDPYQTTADDWQYERRLAGALLSDTRLYRMAAQDRGVADVARVMRDLETVLLEASLSDSSDRHALQRVQQLIAKRDLVMKMQVMATSGSAGL